MHVPSYNVRVQTETTGFQVKYFFHVTLLIGFNSLSVYTSILSINAKFRSKYIILTVSSNKADQWDINDVGAGWGV